MSARQTVEGSAALVPGSFRGGAASLRAETLPFVDASLRRSMEVFNHDTGATTVCMSGVKALSGDVLHLFLTSCC